MSKSYTEDAGGATVAALYVRLDGPYIGRPDVDAWTEERDARTYPGPLPVVAHPPCARWGNLWWSARHKGLGLGDDDGCFAAAVASVRRWGGVLEHPAHSRAWARFGLVPPPSAGWARNPFAPREWTANVFQRNYGHRALKRTWLLYVGDRPPPPAGLARPGVASRLGDLGRQGGADQGAWRRRYGQARKGADPRSFRRPAVGAGSEVA